LRGFPHNPSPSGIHAPLPGGDFADFGFYAPAPSASSADVVFDQITGSSFSFRLDSGTFMIAEAPEPAASQLLLLIVMCLFLGGMRPLWWRSGSGMRDSRRAGNENIGAQNQRMPRRYNIVSLKGFLDSGARLK
jgi:hypothetical protein